MGRFAIVSERADGTTKVLARFDSWKEAGRRLKRYNDTVRLVDTEVFGDARSRERVKPNKYAEFSAV